MIEQNKNFVQLGGGQPVKEGLEHLVSPFTINSSLNCFCFRQMKKTSTQTHTPVKSAVLL